MARSTYYKNFNELVAKGYLVEVSPNHYYFYDKPQKEILNIDSDFPQNRLPSPRDRQLCAWDNGEINNIDKIDNTVINNGSNTSITGDGSILEEAQAEVEALRDCIKEEMLENDPEEMIVGTYIIRWTSILSNRFDSTSFKKEHAELYKAFTKQVASKRFSIA